MIKLHLPYPPSGFEKRGRQRSLPLPTVSLRGYSAAARFGFDHPRQDRGSLHQYALLIREGTDRIARHLDRLVTVVCHIARLQRRIVDHISITLGPLLKEIDRVVEVGDFDDQILPFTQVNWPIKHLRVHFYLTEFVDFQQGKRRGPAPSEDLFSRLLEFKRLTVRFGQKLFVAGAA
jgi:hypothetical protein